VDCGTAIGYLNCKEHGGRNMKKETRQNRKTFEIDMIVKITLTTPGEVGEDEALDSIYCLVAVPNRKHCKIAYEIVDAEVISVKE